METSNHNARIVALDVGEKRIGVATANVVARLASPHSTLVVGDNILEDIKNLLARETACAIVVGLPRGLDGQDTAQTATVRAFGDRLKAVTSLPIHWQDEALTSHKSEEELKAKKGTYKKEEVDALAATYILEDYLSQTSNRGSDHA